MAHEQQEQCMPDWAKLGYSEFLLFDDYQFVCSVTGVRSSYSPLVFVMYLTSFCQLIRTNLQLSDHVILLSLLVVITKFIVATLSF